MCEGGEVVRWKRREDSEVARLERWEDSKVARWKVPDFYQRCDAGWVQDCANCFG